MKFLSRDWLWKNDYYVSACSGYVKRHIYFKEDVEFIPVQSHIDNGYVYCEIPDDDMKTHYVPLHKIVWNYCHDYPIPKGYELDHINRYRDDNRPRNLSLVTKTENISRRRKRGVGKLPESLYSLSAKYSSSPKDLEDFLLLVDFAEGNSEHNFFTRELIDPKVHNFWDV